MAEINKFSLNFKRYQFTIAFEGKPLDSEKTFRRFSSLLESSCGQKSKLLDLIPKTPPEDITKLLKIMNCYSDLIYALIKGTENLRQGILIGFATYEEALAASRQVIDTEILISKTHSRILEIFKSINACKGLFE
jgi:hypothetical protein